MLSSINDMAHATQPHKLKWVTWLYQSTRNRPHVIQEYLVLLCFVLLWFLGVAYFTYRRQKSPPVKKTVTGFIMIISVLWWSATKFTSYSCIPAFPWPRRRWQNTLSYCHYYGYKTGVIIWIWDMKQLNTSISRKYAAMVHCEKYNLPCETAIVLYKMGNCFWIL